MERSPIGRKRKRLLWWIAGVVALVVVVGAVILPQTATIRGHGYFHVTLSLVDTCEVYYRRLYNSEETNFYRQSGSEYLEDYIVAPKVDGGFTLELDYSTHKEPFRAETEWWTRHLALAVLDDDGGMKFHAVRVGGGKPRSECVYHLVESSDGEMVLMPIGDAP